MNPLLQSSLLHPLREYFARQLKHAEQGELRLPEAIWEAALIAWLHDRPGEPILWIAPSEAAARQVHGRLLTWQAVFGPGEVETPSIDLFSPDRLGALRTLRDQSFSLVVTDVESLSAPVPAPEELDGHALTIRMGQERSLGALMEQLTKMGYDPVELVSDTYQIAKRGGILDIFAPGYEDPLRIEFWGDEVVSLRQFNPNTQHSLPETQEITAFTIVPRRTPEATGQLSDYLHTGFWIIESEPGAGQALPHTRRHALRPPAEEEVVFEPIPSARGRLQALYKMIIQSVSKGKETWVLTTQDNRLERSFMDSLSRVQGETLLKEHATTGRVALEKVHFRSLDESSFPLEGFTAETPGLTVITDTEIFGLVKSTSRWVSTAQTNLADLITRYEPGDLVVHEDHGIGRFEQVTLMSVGGTDREYVQLTYDEGDKVYLPVTQLHKMTKYIGDEEEVGLSKLGSTRWKQKRRRAERDTAQIAKQLLQLYARREMADGFGFPENNEMMGMLAASFPYLETPDQKRAIEQVMADMSDPHPMDRLLCGDVGFGKTEVALRAAYRAVLAGKQVAFLCPTTILADQHYESFHERLEPLGVKVDTLSRFRSPAETRQVLDGLARGEVDIVVGTHRLLSTETEYHDLGLLILDEEQRFGVMHKEEIKHMRSQIDVLSMTATPIPRTLHLSLAGIRDLSIMVTPPRGRKAVETVISSYSEPLLLKAVKEELDRGGQAFIIYNKVKSIDSFAKHLSSLLPGARMAVGHGQLGADELEAKMHLFSEGDVDVLVASRIVENGMDIPNANTIVVIGSEAFGLATLHQFRGRVGRSHEQGYAYFLTMRDKLTRSAERRLQALKETAELGSGFEIAMHDLEIRGAGNILGFEQSGHVEGVGFELYTKLLNKAIERQKSILDGQPASAWKRPDMCAVELPLSAYLPDDYIGARREKMKLYRRLLNVQNETDNQRIYAELVDRFGPLPPPAAELMRVNHLRILGLLANVDVIRIKDGMLRLHMVHQPEDLTARLKRFPGWYLNGEQLETDFAKLGTSWMEELEAVLQKLGENNLNPV